MHKIAEVTLSDISMIAQIEPSLYHLIEHLIPLLSQKFLLITAWKSGGSYFVELWNSTTLQLGELVFIDGELTFSTIY